jgi:hypothetical protein
VSTPAPPLLRLIDALAAKDVRDYLAAEREAQQSSGSAPKNPDSVAPDQQAA